MGGDEEGRYPEKKFVWDIAFTMIKLIKIINPLILSSMVRILWNQIRSQLAIEMAIRRTTILREMKRKVRREELKSSERCREKRISCALWRMMKSVKTYRLYFQTRIVQTNQVQRNRNKEKRIRNEIINLIFKTFVIINTFMSITFYLCRLELNFLFSFIFLKIHMEIHMDSKLSIWKSIWIQNYPYGNPYGFKIINMEIHMEIHMDSILSIWKSVYRSYCFDKNDNSSDAEEDWDEENEEEKRKEIEDEEEEDDLIQIELYENQRDQWS